MALDFSLLDADGQPQQDLALPLALHHTLMEAAQELRLSQILRFHQYYQDVEIGSVELEALAPDIAVLLAQCKEAPAQAFLTRLQRMVEQARRTHLRLCAIAD